MAQRNSDYESAAYWKKQAAKGKKARAKTTAKVAGKLTGAKKPIKATKGTSSKKAVAKTTAKVTARSGKTGVAAKTTARHMVRNRKAKAWLGKAQKARGQARGTIKKKK